MRAFLRQAGVDCVLAEADRLCAGATGNTTAKITSQHGLVYDGLLPLRRGKAGMYLHANEGRWRATRHVPEIDCGFEEKDAFVYSLTTGKAGKELAALEKLGFHAALRTAPLPFSVAAPAVRAPGPVRPAALLRRGQRAAGLRAHARAQAGGTSAVTDRGTIRAEKVIVATHFPFSTGTEAIF
ncbi:MAG: hypothetical protein ACLRZH_17425 [Ruthenibacterium lactatiformans]